MDTSEYIPHGLVHSIHTSERRSFRSCRRRWHWAYKDMFYPLVTPPPLEFGVAFHRAMEHFYNPELWGKDFEVQKLEAIQYFKSECIRQFKNYRRLNGEPSEEMRKEYQERLDLGIGMLNFYCEQVSPQWDVGFIPLRVEVPFEVLVLSPQGDLLWCKCDF